jgi:hypothetical protein
VGEVGDLEAGNVGAAVVVEAVNTVSAFGHPLSALWILTIPTRRGEVNREIRISTPR